MYGDHMGGQSFLLARRLVEAGVPGRNPPPPATLLAVAGTTGIRTAIIFQNERPAPPVFDRSASALLTDLEMRGMLEETLVVFLTDFGRTPKVNGNGAAIITRMSPLAYAGGGIQAVRCTAPATRRVTSRGRRLFSGGHPRHRLRAMGIDPRTELQDQLDRPFQLMMEIPGRYSRELRRDILLAELNEAGPPVPGTLGCAGAFIYSDIERDTFGCRLPQGWGRADGGGGRDSRCFPKEGPAAMARAVGRRIFRPAVAQGRVFVMDRIAELIDPAKASVA